MASLGLVSYGSSDEEDSDVEENQTDDQKSAPEAAQKVELVTPKPEENNLTTATNSVQSTTDDIHISDEEDDYPQNNKPTLSAAVPVVPTTSKFLNLPPPSTSKKDDPVVTLLQNKTQNSVQAPLTGPQLEEDIVSNSSALLTGLPIPKVEDKKTSDKAKSNFTYDDELEEEVRPKDYEKTAPKPPPPKAKKRQPVKITVPSLFNDSDEDDEPQAKKPAPSRVRNIAKLISTVNLVPMITFSDVLEITSRASNVLEGKTKLFSLLPEPKNAVKKEANRLLIPHTLGKKPAPAGPKPAAKTPASAVSNLTAKPPVRKPAMAAILRPDLIGPDSDEEEESEATNFFGFSEDGATTQDRTASKRFTFKKDDSVGPLLPPAGFGQPELPEQEEVMPGPAMYPDVAMEMDDAEAEPYGGEIQQYLHDDEFLKIQGKKHRGKEEINIIDVNASDQTDTSELIKNITEETQLSSHSRKRKDMPTSQQKRKHQITYLAFQAKERELELKNQWSQGRQTRKQTQSKYGF